MVFQRGNKSRDPGSADVGFCALGTGSSPRPLSLSLPVCALVPLLPFPCCHWFLSPLFPQAQQPVCSQAQHTLPQPATSSEAATRNYNQLLGAAGRPALQTSILIPWVPGRRQPALGGSSFSEGSTHTLGRRGGSLLSRGAPRGQRLSGLLSVSCQRLVRVVDRKLRALFPAAALALLAYCLRWCHPRPHSGGQPLSDPGFRLAAPLGQFANPQRNQGGKHAVSPASRRQKGKWCGF